MKSKILPWCAVGLAAGGIALGTGCRENKATAEVPPVTAAPTAAEPARVTSSTVAQASASPNALPDAAKPLAPVAAPATAAAPAPAPPPARAPIIITNPTPPAAAAAPANPATVTNAPVEVVLKPTLPDELQVSPALAEVVKMIESGLSEDVLTSYITNSTEPFYVGADQIVYLKDLGASSALITTLLSHENRPEIAEKRKAASAVGPMPAGVGVTTPVQNVYPGQTQTVVAGAEPTPVNPAAETNTAPPPPAEGTEASEVATLPPDQPVTSVTYFYSELAPYGTWVSVPDYGYCWRPTVGYYNPYWSPYRDCGRWLWSDCGWYWYSDYTWGWAPFHYGRWCTYPGYGWLWVPGTTWGPAWVTWRYNAAYCGWAPLPPACGYSFGVGLTFGSGPVGVSFGFGLPASCYTFVGWNHFGSPRPGPHYVSPAYAHQIYRDTTVINNYVVRNNNVIVNKGVGTDHISGPIPKATIRESRPSGAKIVTASTRRETLHSDGTLQVDRQNLVAATGTPVPRSSVRSTPARAVGQPGAPSPATTSASPTSVRSRPTPGGSSSRPVVTGATAASPSATSPAPRGAATAPSTRFNTTPRATTPPAAPRATPSSPTAPRVYPGSSYSTRPATRSSPTAAPSSRTAPSTSTPAQAGSRGASTLRPSPAPSNRATGSRPTSSVTRPAPALRTTPSSPPRSVAVPRTQPRPVTPSYRAPQAAPSFRAPSYAAPSYRAPSYRAPSYTPRSAPSYSAPSIRSAPSYSAPSVRSAPSYSGGGRSTPSQGRFSRN